MYSVPPDPVWLIYVSQEFKMELQSWKRNCSAMHFARLVGFCESEDSILPNPVLEAKTYSLDYLGKADNVEFFSFVGRLSLPSFPLHLLRWHIQVLSLAQGFAYLHTIPFAHGDIRAVRMSHFLGIVFSISFCDSLG